MSIHPSLLLAAVFVAMPFDLGAQDGFAELPWASHLIRFDSGNEPRGVETYATTIGFAPHANTTAFRIPPAGQTNQSWTWQVLPDGLVYRSYLAAPKAPRFPANAVHSEGDSTLWNATLGASVGITRFGTANRHWPEGLQIDAEGSAQVRLDIPEDVDVRSVDFRGGRPISYGWGPHQVKFGYYHLSSHLGDEFWMKHPGFKRLNVARDVLVLGYSYYPDENLRLYAEAGWAFYDDVAKPWEFQFGVDWAASHPTGIDGAPFFATNVQLREEVSFGGGLTVQTGWAWRGEQHARLPRLGAHYYNGKSTQFSFFDDHEQQIGLAIWYDFSSDWRTLSDCA